MTRLRTLLALAIALAAPAHASSSYPDVVTAHLSLSAPPPQLCALCHTNGITGLGTVNTPFGQALRARGAVGSNEASVTTALDRLQTDTVDSDGDTVTDLQELKDGTDPNVATTSDGGAGGGGGSFVLPPPPTYGCGASAAPGFLGAVGVLVLTVLRRRR